MVNKDEYIYNKDVYIYIYNYHTTIRDVQLAKRDMITAIVDINAWSHSHSLKLNAQSLKLSG